MRRRSAVVVTAADGGVGRWTALLLAERGVRVLACGDAPEAMADLPRETASGGWIEIADLDLASPESCTGVLDQALVSFGRLDGLALTGGRTHFGPLEITDEGDVRALFEANFFGPLRLVQAAVPRLREQRRGRIVCLSSAAGRFGLPMSAAYSASHYAIEGLCDALRLELGVFGVQIALVEPGVVRRSFGAARPGGHPVADIFGLPDGSPYAAPARLLSGIVSDLLERAASPQDVAEVMVRAVTSPRPRARYAVTRGTAALLWARKLLPDRLLDARLAKVMGLDGALETER